MEIMEGIDPNPDNYVGGAILSTSTVLVGCLLRLEPNKQTEVCVYVCTCVYIRPSIVNSLFPVTNKVLSSMDRMMDSSISKMF